ncbi:MAG: PSD1 and planctomycete cytochrome C domain-containing protein [Planctomycetota bacterium]
MTIRELAPIVAATLLLAHARCARAVDFQSEVRPILSAQCFKCHGPDTETRESGLRLDTRDGATGDLGGYAAVVAGSVGESELIARITSSDPDLQMPPPSTGKSLSAAEVATLRDWIEEGAVYEQHWAFAPIKRPPLPNVKAEGWSRNPIDRFVLAKIEGVGLSPAPEAGRYRLVRRLYLDLIGLPPTPEEADAFVADQSPDAYERLVDRLMASPHYGERWARRWLDLARYSDTKGYEKDKPRTMWLYRDWVINAINDDMPFDQFTIEQIAGDMLPGATIDQRIATGFHRNTMTNEEGGIDPQEFRYHAVVDRVATTGATWLGLTVGCAQCHTHKYDPLTHDEYFGLFAMLNNADELEVPVPTPESTKRRDQALERINRRWRSLAESQQPESGAGPSGFDKWVEQQRRSVSTWRPLRPAKVEADLPTIEVLPDGSVLASGDVTKSDIYEVTVDPGVSQVSAIRIEALPHETLPNNGPGRQLIKDGARQGNFLLTEVHAQVVQEDAAPRDLRWAKGVASYAPSGIEASNAIDGRHDTSWSIVGREGKRHTLELTLAEPVAMEPGQLLRIRLDHESFYPAALGRFRISVSSQPPSAEGVGHTDEVIQALVANPEEWTDQQRTRVMRRYLEAAPELKSEREKLAKLESNAPRHTTALVMQERRRDPRVTHRRHRGEYLKVREEVAAGVPAVLPPLGEDQPANRLGLARWLVSAENPLTPRVVVNRQWQAFFGAGIVATMEDFGYQGDYPTHPDLLDLLADEFVRVGWSRKSLHRLIVTSATYRQAASNPRASDVDPENKLVARSPRTRLDAEQVRDSVLAISGQLSSKLGGPSVFPPQPPGITERSYGPLKWVVSKGEDRYRRGLYTFNKRTAPYAAFGLFDAPSGEYCVTRRSRSNTPLQALALLNDTVISEAARALALACLDTHTGDREVAERMWRRSVARPPTEVELERLLVFVGRQRERLVAGELDPFRVLNAGPQRVWRFDEGAEGWTARKQASVEVQDGALVVTGTGGDPFVGVDFAGPEGKYTLELTANVDAPGNLELFWTTRDNPTESAERLLVLERSDGPNGYTAQFSAASELRSLRLDTGAGPGVTRLYEIKLTRGDGLLDPAAIKSPIGAAAWQLAARALLNLDEVLTRP